MHKRHCSVREWYHLQAMLYLHSRYAFEGVWCKDRVLACIAPGKATGSGGRGEALVQRGQPLVALHALQRSLYRAPGANQDHQLPGARYCCRHRRHTVTMHATEADSFCLVLLRYDVQAETLSSGRATALTD